MKTTDRRRWRKEFAIYQGIGTILDWIMKVVCLIVVLSLIGVI